MHSAEHTSVTRLTAFDPQALVLALQEGFLEHVQLEKGRFDGQIVHSVSAQCRTDWGQYNLALLAQGDLSPQWLTVGIFLQGQGVWRVQGQELRNGDLVVYGQGSDMRISLPPLAQWVGVQIPQYKLQALGLHLSPGVSALSLPGQLSPQTMQALSDLSMLLGPDRRQDVAATRIDQAHQQLQNLIWGELARRWRQPSGSAALSMQTRERLVQAVHQWSEDNSTTPLRIDALCEALAIPIWHLERAFQQTYGMAPQRLITLHRLAKARRALLTQPTSVTEVAMSLGFWHLGRFAGLYKNYYGESPSASVRRMG
ncbi:MAG: helix-turn-helix transcriptional regulator [Hydrogenophaga sp.]